MERKREALVKEKERIRLGSEFGRRTRWKWRAETAATMRSGGGDGVEGEKGEE